ncbi:minor capsid protein [Cytobacillus firmus]|uniref:minor capsid protein n=1 Tax=Cytobacillus firmus TaxID=1399 RepID=UPI003BA15AC6
MRAQEFINFLTAEGFNVFPDPNFIPDVEESQLPALFVFGSGGGEPDDELPMEFPTFQVIVKGRSYKADSSQMDKTEQLAKQLINKMHQVNRRFIGDNLVYYIRSVQSNPIPIGLDTLERPVFSTNFRLRIQPVT